jgi:two-component system alkaline phosphatase synthesis response regulator PhoP
VARVLVIEDNPDLAYGLRNNLEIEGHQVTVAVNGPDGLDQASRGSADLVILDLMLPGLDGFRVLRALRERDRETPVLILTARGEEADKVRGLRLGADDYVTKPFGVLELLARVEAQLRRRGAPGARSTVRFGDIEVDRRARVVRRGGEAVSLAPKELDLLLALVDAEGAAVSRMTLMHQVWGYQADVLSRTVDSHIAELRRKLEPDPGRPRHILTARKFGYRLEP